MKNRIYPLRHHLFFIIGILLIPALVMTGLMLREVYTTGEEHYERDAREISRRLSAVIDREIVSVTKALQVLSTSRLFSEGRFEELQQQALEIRDIVSSEVIIKDVAGQQLVNTRIAWGSPLPLSLPEADKEALEKISPTISDLFIGATARRPIVSINVPIVRSGRVVGLVNTGVDPFRLSNLLTAGGVPEGWTAAIVDRKGMIIARSRDADKFVGTLATEDLRNNAIEEEGTWIGSTADGQPVLAGYIRSEFTGWRAAAGVPKQIVETPVWRSLRWAGLSTAIGLIAVLLFVNWVAQPIARSIEMLAVAATDLGRGKGTITPTTTIAELAVLSKELQLASERHAEAKENLERQVAERTKQLTEANANLVNEVKIREQIEGQLRQSQKLEAIGQLTGGLAHDFNNLLTVIGGSLQMLQRRLDRADTGAMQRYLDSAAEGVKKASGITHRLLAFGRQQPLAPQALDVNVLLKSMSDLLHRSLGESTKVESVLSDELWNTHADPNQLENAILNLALNARDAMSNGGRLIIETVNVELDQRYADQNPGAPKGQFVLVAVTDTGVGMAPDTAAKAFDPFFTTKPTGQGTGLGLSQVYGFVRQSGGYVKIDSEPGVGTSVKLYLPRFIGSSEAMPLKIQPSIQGPDRPLQGYTILVVEDDEGVRRLTLDYLAEIGFSTLEAEGGAAALRLLDANPQIDLLFTDVVMPDMNGRRLADEALTRRPALPVLFTSGYTKNAVVQGGIIDPEVQLLPKPFTMEQLREKLVEVLGQVTST